MSSKSIFLSAIFAFFAAASLPAQIKLSGIVDDAATGNPLEFANVVLLKPDSTFITGTSCDSAGVFAFSNIPKGDYWLSSTFVGYNKTFTLVKNLTESRDCGKILLQPSGKMLNEITVKGASLIQKVDRKLLIPTDAQKKASNNGATLLRNLQLSRIEVNPLDTRRCM